MPAASSNRKRRKAARRYDPKYLEFGFFWSGKRETRSRNALCVVKCCATTVTSPWHLHTPSKPVDYFRRKRDD
ncbi:Hypothetical protein FKW44_019314 [Caligus rogercresseyi]|uniref:Uncharacterized protein n=1 Tax=Caligus rogercresseyi TaxID=217165 RepID=A0A7T8GWE3_CALRO|nr:Hypothetical protein FKW44_019314 [Caligus rogercresseyi]